MPTIAPNQPIEQRSAEFAISNRLPAGEHRFELVVIDDAGQASAPTDVVVTVVKAGSDDRPDRRDLRDRLRPDLRDRLRDRIDRPIRR